MTPWPHPGGIQVATAASVTQKSWFGEQVQLESTKSKNIPSGRRLLGVVPPVVVSDADRVGHDRHSQEINFRSGCLRPPAVTNSSDNHVPSEHDEIFRRQNCVNSAETRRAAAAEKKAV